MIGDDGHDRAVIRQLNQAADHVIDGFIGADYSLPASLKGRFVSAADFIRLPEEEVARVIGSMSLDERRVPLP